MPPDPHAAVRRQAADQAIYGANGQDDAHGYDFVDEDENVDSDGGASYYAWDPPEAPGMRFISIDTLSEGGIVEQSSNGNIDDPQFQWLERELEVATGSDKVIVVFGHHPIRSLNVERARRGGADRARGVDAHPRRRARARPQPGLRHRPARIDADPLRRAEPAPPGDPRRDAVRAARPATRTWSPTSPGTRTRTGCSRSRAAGGGVWWGIETVGHRRLAGPAPAASS